MCLKIGTVCLTELIFTVRWLNWGFSSDPAAVCVPQHCRTVLHLSSGVLWKTNPLLFLNMSLAGNISGNFRKASKV